jgi:hypothetical protein
VIFPPPKSTLDARVRVDPRVDPRVGSPFARLASTELADALRSTDDDDATRSRDRSPRWVDEFFISRARAVARSFARRRARVCRRTVPCEGLRENVKFL